MYWLHAKWHALFPNHFEVNGAEEGRMFHWAPVNLICLYVYCSKKASQYVIEGLSNRHPFSTGQKYM